MKRNKEKLIKLSRDYLDCIEQLLPGIEREILLKIINIDTCTTYEVPFNRGRLIIDLFNTSEYILNIPGKPFYESSRISLDVIDAIGMPSFSTPTALKCREEEDYFIISILTELLSNVKTGLNLMSFLREIRSYCEISSYFVPMIDDINVEIVNICCSNNDENNSSLNKKEFRIYYIVDGSKKENFISIIEFNSIGFANKLIS